MNKREMMRLNTVVHAKTTSGADQLIRWAKKENLICNSIINYNNYIQDNENNTLCYCIGDGRVYDLSYCKKNNYTVIELNGEYRSKKVLYSIIGVIILIIILSKGII